MVSAAVHRDVRSGAQLLHAEVHGLPARRATRAESAAARRVIYAGLKQARALVPGHLPQQVSGLLLLGEPVEVRHTAAGLRAPVDGVNPAVAHLQTAALSATVKRPHMHAESEWLASHH